MKNLIFPIFIFVILIIGACSSETSKNQYNENQTNDTKKTKINRPANPIALSIAPLGKITFGDEIEITINLKDSLPADSTIIFFNRKKAGIISKYNEPFKLNTGIGKTGSNKLKIVLYRDSLRFQKSLTLTLASDIVPVVQKYKLIKEYPHDKHAFTQGLFYHDGIFYEATGMKGESSVRKVNIQTGEILQSYTIPNNIFGEGITLIDNKIVQLSWQSHVGYVYNKETLQLLQQFNYQTEGWGITTIGDKVIMSDGTSNLYILESNNFTETDRIEVYDNKGPVSRLNELEYINGEIFANVYMTDKIARIDPKTGKVTAYINLSGILKEKDRHPKVDVLNGIAYDSINKRIFITGKYWPKLFEIEVL